MAQTASMDGPIEFSIPTQPLASSLDRYGDVTGREAFYDTSLAQGRVSGDVHGVFTPREALQKLLTGTGLSARFMADNSFVLLPASQIGKPASRPSGSAALDRQYYGLIQDRLRDAFCRSSDAPPGNYRFVAVFWIGPNGANERSQRLGSSGNVGVDQRIDAILRDVRFDEPPAAFRQPVLIMVVPQAAGVTMGCDAPLPVARQTRGAP
ncbi:secretin and TonB N-terminal domain-containing protein [Bradyrhizobium sp. Leo121]|uniref:secretin and TonB N-terminal domain-containing protein n=1 Tax=Bradyrhizobium sp. Leo121 TaxID=1571195 RepID=UPI001029A811|nr:secretin and TonB N-terminal domain-containing protein [Bradyrhizobium sp. Leo121]